jgi:hypothetical protein
MTIYWHETKKVADVTVSAIRDTANRHAGAGDSRAEIAYLAEDG